MNRSFRSLVAFALAAFVLLACNLPSRFLAGRQSTRLAADVVQSTLTAAAGADSLPVTPTSVAVEPAPQPLAVDNAVFKDEKEDQPSAYMIELEYPVFKGAPEAAVAGLNAAIDEVIARQRAGFDGMVQNTPADMQVGPSSLSIGYEIRENDGRYVSIYFELSTYASGAAHPLPFSETLNYAIDRQHVLTLNDLFRPGVDYLAVLSEKSLTSLQTQGITGGESGAAPTEENYRNWNITPDGLVITFDPYQVAAYAMGYVTVTIPWDDLRPILALDGF